MADDALAFKVDLTNCDREPIHVLGTVQPFAFLVTLTSDWMISRVSANICTFVDRGTDDLLGTPATAFFSERALHAIRNRLTMLRGGDAVERLLAQPLFNDGRLYDIAVHLASGAVVIEAELTSQEDQEAAAMVRAMINRLSQSSTLPAFLREGARQVRAITGFDRVMVYRFDEDQSGEVVAETLRPGVDSFMGQHFPASDIPAQARKLYMRNLFRVIADVDAVGVPLVSQPDFAGVALDQSLCVARAVSPIHIEYLKNMGVRASLSISIIVEGKLWGLFACHHYSPRLPSFAARTAGELFGQMFSLMLESRERREIADYESSARSVTDRLLAAIAQDSDLLDNAAWLGDVIGDIIPADGVGVYVNGNVSLSGLAPGRTDFEAIVHRVNAVTSGLVFATDTIQSLLPSAEVFADIASGMLAIPLSRAPRDHVVLFRSERLRSVHWAGNPEKAVELGPNGERLTPRKSFEAWSQLVKGRSAPFTAVELRVAEMLRTGMLDVLLRLSESAGEERQKANERQELLIAELNHRVRNILALIRGLISQTRSGAETVEGFIGTLDKRIQALARAHDQITADRWAPARLIDLIEAEAGAYAEHQRDRVKLDGPNVLLHPSAFTALALVVHELMTNAAKYGALSDSGTVEIGWRVDTDGSLAINWQEKGGPPVTAPTRRGFGSTIIERSIPYDLGGQAEVNFHLNGVAARFCVPSRFVAGLATTGESRVVASAIEPGERPLEGQMVLLVEDNMVIALDAEDALRALGAREVLSVPTVGEALSALDRETFGFALLDYNLGIETSTAVAETLADRGIPFAFATGYGEHPENVSRFAGVETLSKPYGAPQIARLFGREVT